MSDPTTALATTVDPKDFSGGGSIATGAKLDQPRASFAYVGFFGEKTKADTARALIAAGIETNEFFLADAAGPMKVKPFQCYLLMSARFQTHCDDKQNGKRDDIILDGGRDTWNAGYRPELLGLVAVRQGGDLTLATFSFRNALGKAFEKLAGLTDVEHGGAATLRAQWAGRSAAHAKSAVLDWPQFRVCGTVWGEGGDFNLSHATVQPTPEADIPVIQKLIGQDFQSKVAPITLQFRKRVLAWRAYAELDDDEKAKAKTKLPF